DQIISWGWWRESSHGPQIVLQDGSLFIGDPTAMRTEEITFTAEHFGELTIPRETVAGIVFRPQTELIDRDRALRQLIEERRTQDSVWMFNGDRIDTVAVSA